MIRRLCLLGLFGIGLAPMALAAPGPSQGTGAKAPAAAAKPDGAKAQAAPAPKADPKAAPASAAQEPVETHAYLQVPLLSERFASVPVAAVEDDVITLRELNDALMGSHGAHAPGEKAGKKDFTPVLDRLVDAKLIALEAREMGIDELPEYKKALAEYRTSAAQELLKEKVTRDVKADPVEVERLYKDAVREWKVSSALVDREEYGKELIALVKGGKTFDAAVAQIVAEKKGKAGGPAGFLPRAQMLPQVLAALSAAKVGDVTPPIKVLEGYAVMKVDDVRYPDVPAEREQAEQRVLLVKRTEALTKYYTAAVKRHATVDKHLLEKLDFDAKKPGLDALARDRRVIARIPGAKNLTVADLAEGLKQSFFHGAGNAAKEKKINREKYGVFDGLLARQIIPLEVKREHIDESPELARRVRSWEDSALFSQVIQSVIVPEVKAGEPEQRKYYEAHKAEYATPAMYRLESLVFRNAKSAQAAVDSLRAGTDFAWLNANADGQVAASERKLKLEGVLAATTLPADVSKALAGTKGGDLRLYQEQDTGFYHAVRVVDVTPAGYRQFEEVQGAVQQKVLGEQVAEGIRAYAAKLRKARNVKVYLTRIAG